VCGHAYFDASRLIALAISQKGFDMPNGLITNAPALVGAAENMQGASIDRLLASNMDPRVCRPWIGDDGRSYVINAQGNVVTANALATLRKDDWIQLDDAIIAAAKPRLKLVADLRARGLQYSIPNGMGKTVLQTETMSDISAAELTMDGLNRTGGDRPAFELTNLPLPIAHKDFSFSARQLAASRNGGSPLDTTTAELAGRRVAEIIEQLTIGLTIPGTYTFGGGTVYGLTNFTGTLTRTITTPTGANGGTTIIDITAMMTQSRAIYHNGPWMLYTSPNWAQFLDQDYSTAKGDNTLRQRIMALEGIMGVTTLDYLEDYDVVLVQMTSDVIRMVVGMELTTMQWEVEGGLQKQFKVMAIIVPQVRMDQNSRTGIVYGSV